MDPIVLGQAACRFPDAASPAELWRNVWEGRRAFRPIPAARLNLASYAAGRIDAAETITGVKAGLISDWDFARARFRVPIGTYDATDLTHWLALDVAADCIAANGGRGALPAGRTAVVVANTLTGEFSRTQQLRLRLPFLDAMLAEACAASDLPEKSQAPLRAAFAGALRGRLAEPTEDSLAGGLSNTIAGRIANHFDLGGGAYTVDAACASSLVAIANAATLIETGAADAVLVCAVDLSLDPFELVGFSRNGALAAGEMRVFDTRSSGFWPGEGAAAVLLARPDVCDRRQIAPAALLRGWGISTDGAGGLTRPSTEGQLTALRRAHERAGTDPADLSFVEAHGTGTQIGDPVEVRALARLVGGRKTPLPIGSIKANIGHTKAAAGLAGLVKTLEALAAGAYPPHVACPTPHPVFQEVGRAVLPADRHIRLDPDRAALAGISSFGFGGINAHVVVERAPRAARAAGVLAVPQPLGHQDAELYLYAADDPDRLVRELGTIAARAPGLSLSECADLATLSARGIGRGRHRVAIVASGSEPLAAALDRAAIALREGRRIADADAGLWVAQAVRAPRIGYIFPGQAAPVRPGGVWRKRFGLSSTGPATTGTVIADTAVAQPAIAAATLAALEVLDACGLTAEVALGHSLGEVAALAWAGAVARDRLADLVAMRGRLMSEQGAKDGAMLLVRASEADCIAAMTGLDLSLACRNAPGEQIVSGRRVRIETLKTRLSAQGVDTADLPVSHAFHSPDMAVPAKAFGDWLATAPLSPPSRRVISTVTGGPLDANCDLARLLTDQLTQPVQFDAAMQTFEAEVDLAVEVGPGTGMTRLARDRGIDCVPVDAFADSFVPLLSALAQLFAAGADIVPTPFAERCHRPVDLAHRPAFLSNPCGLAGEAVAALPGPATETAAPVARAVADPDEPILDTIRRIVADHSGLPVSQVGPEMRFLDDLHLNSLAVGKLVAGICQSRGLTQPTLLTEFANASLSALAAYLSDADRTASPDTPAPEVFPGVEPWIRTFERTHIPAQPPARPETIAWQVRKVGAPRIAPPAPPTAPETAPSGALLVLGDAAADTAAPQLWAAIRDALSSGARHLCLLHGGQPVAALGATLATEGVFDSVTVISTDPASPDTAIAAALSHAATGFRELDVTAKGQVASVCYRAAAPGRDPDAVPIGSGDVVLATGGAKGIGAECALRLAEATGARLILCGRSDLQDTQVAASLERARQAGLTAIYRQMDVADAGAVAAAIADATDAVGPVTCLLHAAGLNRPARFEDLPDSALPETRAAKDIGLRNLLDALPAEHLKCVVGFGSIIGHLGLAGEAHYAFANALQAAALGAFQKTHPAIRVLSLDWSIWQGAGMGERLGVLDRLSASGVDPLSLDMALDTFERLMLRDTAARGSQIVCSRYAPLLPRLVPAPHPLPQHRFLDRIRVHYPGIELVAESVLQPGHDPYLADHRIDGMEVLPAVIGLEAMAAAAEALMPLSGQIEIRDAGFARAVTLESGGRTTLRLAALVIAPGRIRCTLRSSGDGFAAEAAAAEFRVTAGDAADGTAFDIAVSDEPIPAADLYGRLFFNAGRFRRLDRITRASAFEVAADFTGTPVAAWFGGYQPQMLLLGDPGLRDAGLHALQVCVPQKRVIPVRIKAIRLNRDAGAPVSCAARQTAAEGDRYVFDIAWFDANGRITETWRGAVFRAIEPFDVSGLPDTLFAPWLERALGDATGRSDLRAALVLRGSRDARRRDACARLGVRVAGRRADGKPLAAGPGRQPKLSVSHTDGATLAITAAAQVGCDIEPYGAVPSGATDLGRWCMHEALQKAGTACPAAPGRHAAQRSCDADRLRVGGTEVFFRIWQGRIAVAVALSDIAQATEEAMT